MRLLFIIFILFDLSFAKCPDGTISIPPNYGGNWSCLLFNFYGRQYAIADSQCISYGGHLVSVPNRVFNYFVAQVAYEAFNDVDFGDRYWIGVNNVLGNGWENLDDGSTTTFFDWAPGEPNNFTDQSGCVSVNMSGYWYNDDCFNMLPFVCELDEIEMSSTVAIETTTPIVLNTELITTSIDATTPTSTTDITTTSSTSTTSASTTPLTTIPNCQYTSQDFTLSFFLDGTTYPSYAGFVSNFLTAISSTPNPANAERVAYLYNTATDSLYISPKMDFSQLMGEYINQGVQSLGTTTVSLNYAFAYYQQSGPLPSAETTIAPTIIMVTSSYIIDLDQTKEIIDHLRQNRTAYIVSITLSSEVANQLSEVGFDLVTNLTDGTQDSATDAAASIINMICSVNNNH